eukprot:CAMPEP_0206283028 /NCGR_PEP_ID=MMETSP0047_2-20121206/40004_1 /ASSEMBLY_ACC=CAM_ASM_000192 /TAXON_ID=195065 /ORGANISM="Chroomonas mesostigmatica_cf, Strain CCMP1168" /LENGTH=73 /DNA_ID=CAMNT_0053713351 /DNA_START=1 /DNA_END=222 /DNA_ORIENTATION=-
MQDHADDGVDGMLNVHSPPCSQEHVSVDLPEGGPDYGRAHEVVPAHSGPDDRSVGSHQSEAASHQEAPDEFQS